MSEQTVPTWDVAARTDLGTLYVGDVSELSNNVSAASVDMVFADPPFNLGKDYGTTVDDSRDPIQYDDWCRTWLTDAWAALVPGGALFVYHMPSWLLRFGGWALETLPGATFRHWISCYMPTRPPIRGRLHPSHYGLLYVTKGDPKTFHRIRVPVPACRSCGEYLKDYGGHRKDLHPDGLSLSDFWSDTHGVHHRSKKFGRKAPALPEFMPERCVLTSTDPGDVVLELFAGSAPTAAMAERHGRRWSAVELSDCVPAIRRIGAERRVFPVG